MGAQIQPNSQDNLGVRTAPCDLPPRANGPRENCARADLGAKSLGNDRVDPFGRLAFLVLTVLTRWMVGRLNQYRNQGDRPHRECNRYYGQNFLNPQD